MPKRDPHDVLGVERGAGMSTVKAAWRRLARAHHPDLSGSDAAAARAATARMAEINAAYDLLVQRDAAQRAGAGPRATSATEASTEGATYGGPPGTEAPRRRSGPPRPRPMRPVTGRVDTSGTFRPRNSTTGPGIRMDAGAVPPRARPASREPLRASDPNGPVRRRRSSRWRPPPEPALDEARAVGLEFGKFHGHTLGQVADFEPSYIDWLAATTFSRYPDLGAAARVIRRDLDDRGIRRRLHPAGRSVPPPD